MGHRVESGYGVISDKDLLTILDPDATPLIQDIIKTSPRVGIKVTVIRKPHEGRMKTVDSWMAE